MLYELQNRVALHSLLGTRYFCLKNIVDGFSAIVRSQEMM
uniref:Uncharacterized protein n=1 Tax=Anguilla anguilla TaxID=7936 RepID=A0A0E9SIZ3_ANGAN